MSEIKTWQASYNEDFQKNGHDCSAQWEHVAREISDLRAALAEAEKRIEYFEAITTGAEHKAIDQAMQGANKTRQPSE